MAKRSSIGLKVILVMAGMVSADRALAQPEKTKAVLGKRTQDFLAAFEKGDAKTLASYWTNEGSLFDPSGRELKGRDAIQKHFESAMASRKGAKLVIMVTASRHITPEVVLEEGITEVILPDGPPSVAQFTAVLVKKDGGWYFECVREIPAQPPTHAKHFEDLEWLMGNWSGDAEKGETANATYELVENGNFVISSFAITVKGAAVHGGTQWIAYDPVDKQIRSWTFFNKGGFSEATWTKDGNKWVIATKAKTADGKKVTVTNVLTKVDADQATWQATHLNVDGKSMPDGPVIKLKRTATK